MNRLKIAAHIVVAIKLLMAAPCMPWGLLIGVIGLGPDGAVNLEGRVEGLCVFFGAMAVAYPFSLILRRGPANYIIVILTALPLGLALYHVLIAGMSVNFRMEDASDLIGLVVVSSICILFPISALADYFLSLRLQNGRTDGKTRHH